MLSLVVALTLSQVLRATPDTAPDTALAGRATREAAAYAARDGGRLWGIPLTTPLLIVDPRSRQAISAAADSAGLMVSEQEFYAARLSDRVQVANTSMRWGGRTWAMVLTPLPADSVERGILLMHEVWHSVQARVGVPLESPDNPQLATVAGRAWLMVEGRALDAALASSGPAQRRAMADAFAARQRRRTALPGSDSTERPLELAEGLAEYSGIVVVVVPSERARVGRERLARLEQGGSLMRSFPYATGTAWALLLDIVDPGWRKRVTSSSDLAYMAAVALGIDTNAVAHDDARFAAYGLEEIQATERGQYAAQVARQDSLSARYVSGPTLRLPLAEMNMSFDPNKVEPLPDVGTVYQPFRLSDRWGVLDADSSGAMVSSNFSEVRVAAPGPGGTSGSGWRVTLNAGWAVVPGPRPGDLMVQKR